MRPGAPDEPFVRPIEPRRLTDCHPPLVGALAEAEECLREGLDGSKIVYGEGHVEALISSTNLSDALLRRHGDDAEGEAASLLDETWGTLAHARGDPRVSYILHDAIHNGRVSYVVDGLAEHVRTPRPTDLTEWPRRAVWSQLLVGHPEGTGTPAFYAVREWLRSEQLECHCVRTS